MTHPVLGRTTNHHQRPPLEGGSKLSLPIYADCCALFVDVVMHHTSQLNRYTPFRFELEESLLNWGTAAAAAADNVLAVRADATSTSDAWIVSWYYDGAGIYRHVSLTVADPAVHIGPFGVYAPSLVTGAINHHHRRSSSTGAGLRGSTQSYADAIVNCSVDVDVANTAVAKTPLTASAAGTADTAAAAKGYREASTNVTVRATVFDADGAAVGAPPSHITAMLPSGATTTVLVPPITMKNTSLWSVDHPVLYTVQTEVLVDGVVVDTVNTTIGVRQIEFDRNEGYAPTVNL